MAALTCEFLIRSEYRGLYDMEDEHSLAAFHQFVDRRMYSELRQKYGPRCIALTSSPENWNDDFGLLADCDFHELDDGSMLVTFSREINSRIEKQLLTYPACTLEANLSATTALNFA